MAHKPFHVGQKALIEKGGRVLVVFFPNGWLDFPGGRIDEGESDIIDALKLRSVKRRLWRSKWATRLRPG